MPDPITPLITFFIPVYNTRPYLRSCLDSVINQEGDYEIEIIVIDDASPDKSGELVKHYTDDPRLKFLQHKENQGAIATWNEGFQLARGKYISRIDSDDRLRRDFLKKTVPILERSSNVGLVYGDIALIDSTGKITSEKNNVNRGNQALIGDELKAILTSNYIPAPTVLARREAWMLSIPMPVWLGFCDWYQSVKMAQQWDFAYVDEVIADYRVHGGNMHSSMIRDRTGEATTFRVIQEVFDDEKKSFSRAEQREILAENYRNYGNNYFGAGMWKDARRCYGKALMNGVRMNPTLRRWVVSFFPQNFYTAVKKTLKD